MKNETCRNTVEAILASDGDFSPALLAHLEQCRDCAAWAESWQLLRNAGTAPEKQAVPLTLDFAILRRAGKRADKIAANKRWMLPKWFYAVSSAACAVMAAWLVAYSHYEQNVKPAMKWDTAKAENAIFELSSAIEYNHVFMNISPRRNAASGASSNDNKIKVEVIDALRLSDLMAEAVKVNEPPLPDNNSASTEGELQP